MSHLKRRSAVSLFGLCLLSKRIIKRATEHLKLTPNELYTFQLPGKEYVKWSGFELEVAIPFIVTFLNAGVGADLVSVVREKGKGRRAGVVENKLVVNAGLDDARRNALVDALTSDWESTLGAADDEFAAKHEQVYESLFDARDEDGGTSYKLRAGDDTRHKLEQIGKSLEEVSGLR